VSTRRRFDDVGERHRARRRSPLVVLALAVSGLVSAACSDEPERGAGSQVAAANPSTSAELDTRTVTGEYLAGLAATVHLPVERGRRPLVVMIPGGAWRTADPSGFAGLARHLSAAGFVAMPVEIRAGDDGVRYPVPVHDVLCAAAFGVATARSNGIDPVPVVILGHSSGAHLAALATLAPDDHAGSCPYGSVSPDALVGLAGTYDVERLPELAETLFGQAPADAPDAWEAGNPLNQAGSRPTVPVLLVHGADDELVPTSFTTEFAAALESADHPTTVEMIAGAGHHDVYAAPTTGDVISSWISQLRREQPVQSTGARAPSPHAALAGTSQTTLSPPTTTS
jgi:acetyl esterase/lipase